MKFNPIMLTLALAMALPATMAIAKTSENSWAFKHPAEPALDPTRARIYFYRSDAFAGFAVQPTVMINGESAGERSKPGDYFYVDVPAGTYEISTETEKKEAVTATVTAGQTMYIRFDVNMGFFIGHVQPSIIDPQQAITEIKDCDFRAPDSVPSVAAAAPAAPAAAADATAPATPAPPTTAAAPATAPAPAIDASASAPASKPAPAAPASTAPATPAPAPSTTP